jgi:hypothetical protein
VFEIGRHTDKISYDKDGKQVVDDVYIEEHILIDDFMLIDGKWVRVTKILQQSTGVLCYYLDGRLVHKMPYKDMNQMHKDESAKNPIKLNELDK